MKRFYITLIVSCILVLNCAMTCDDDNYEPVIYDSIVSITAQNANNEGKYPFLSDEPIKKEAYVIAMAYLVKDSLGHVFPLTTHRSLKERYKLKVITENEFDNEYQAGSDVTSLFTVYHTPVDTCMHQLILRRIPNPGIHSFTVEMHLEDTILTGQTKPVELK